MQEGDVPLAALIKALRSELITAISEGKDSALNFSLGPIELDLELQVAKDAGASGGIKFWGLSAQAQGKQSNTNTQRIHLVLNPPSGGVLIGGSGKPE